MKVVETMPEEEHVYRPCDTELFYCRALKKHLAVPPGETELITRTIPKISCYNCGNNSCPSQWENQQHLTRLIDRILNSRNNYGKDGKDFIESLWKYRVVYVPK